MGRESRRKKERRAQKRQEASLLRVTVVSHPSHVLNLGDGPLSEIPLIRSALLYADSIELMSPVHTALDFAEAVQDAGRRLGNKIINPASGILKRYVARTPLSPEDEEHWALIDETIRKEGIPYGLPERELRNALADIYDRENEENEQRWRRLSDERGFSDIKQLSELGLVTSVRNGLDSTPLDTFGPDEWLSRWWQVLQGRIEAGSARLLLDDESQAVVARALCAGVVEPGSLFSAHAGEAMVGAGLIARLPAFPAVRTEELLELRGDLRRPLTRYRAATARLAKESNLTIGPDSASRIDAMWVSDVAPAIAGIEESMLEHGLVRKMAAAAGADIQTFVTKGAALGVGLGALTDIAGWASALVGVAAPTAQAAFSGWKASTEGKAAAKRADLFYLYEANRRLEH